MRRVIIATALLALAGCGSSASYAPTTTKGATNSQYAAIVATNAATLNRLLSDTRKCVGFQPQCDATTQLKVLELSVVAKGLWRDLDQAPATIGAPPSEIARLVSDTGSAALAVAREGQVVAQCRPYPADCSNIGFTNAVASLSRALPQWQPYGVKG